MLPATLHVLDSFTVHVKMPAKVFFPPPPPPAPREENRKKRNERTYPVCVTVATPSACK